MYFLIMFEILQMFNESFKMSCAILLSTKIYNQGFNFYIKQFTYLFSINTESNCSHREVYKNTLLLA